MPCFQPSRAGGTEAVVWNSDRQTAMSLPLQAVGINFRTAVLLSLPTERNGRRQCSLSWFQGSVLGSLLRGWVSRSEADRTAVLRAAGSAAPSAVLALSLDCSFPPFCPCLDRGNTEQQGVNDLIHTQLLNINQWLVYVCHGLNLM